MKSNKLDLLTSQLASASDWLSATDLAFLLHTTTRTVRNYVRELNRDAGDTPIIISGTKGYRWNSEAENLRGMYRITRVLPQSPQERELYLLRKLLYQNQCDLSTFSRDLMVSERTVQLDLEQIRPRLRKYGLHLQQRRDAFSITGKERDKRRLSRYCIAQTCKTELFTREFLARAFPVFDVPAIDALAQKILSAHKLSLNAYSRYDFLLLLLIQMERFQHGECLTEEKFPVTDLEKTPDYSAARAIASALELQHHLSFTEPEIRYTTILILSKADYVGTEDFLENTVYRDLPSQIEYALNILQRRLGVDFTQELLPEQLTPYFHRLIIRSIMELPTFNPLAEGLRSGQTILYNCAAWIMTQFIQQYHITPSDGEVGFLTLKLSEYVRQDLQADAPVTYTLVCPDFGNISQRLRQNISRKFGTTLQLSSQVDTLDVEHIPSADLCLSVLPLENQRRLVHISPMLTENDCEAIRREAGKIERARRRNTLIDYLTCYSKPDYFERDLPLRSEQETIHHICGRLRQYDAVGADFEQVILQRETVDSTAFFNLIALPHGCISGVTHNSLYIILNQESIPWGRSKANLVVLMALQRDLLEDFKQIYKLFIRMFSQPKNISAILGADDLDSFIDIISKLNLD